MNPYTGEVFALGEDLLPTYSAPGDSLDMETYRREVARLAAVGGRLSDEERAAAAATKLVLVSEQVAQKMKLGVREQERRRKRRKVERAARRRNR